MYLLQDTTHLDTMKTPVLQGQTIDENGDLLGGNPNSNDQTHMDCSNHGIQRNQSYSALHQIPLSSSSHDQNSRTGKSDDNYDYQTLSDGALNESCSDSSFDAILDEIDGAYDSYDDDSNRSYRDEVMVVPIKFDNYVNKRSLLLKGNRNRRELLLDDASGIMDALRAFERSKGEKFHYFSDEESYADTSTTDDNDNDNDNSL
eukprot:jgi/Psemu1/291387/fgenesh1_pg.688_\